VLPQRLWAEPGRQKHLVQFELKSRHLVASILVTFLRINWSNVVHFEQIIIATTKHNLKVLNA